MSEMGRWLGGLSALLGAWIVAVPFVYEIEAEAVFWNHIIVGAAILVFSGYNAVTADETDSGSPWAAGLSALLGLWMIASPFVFGMDVDAVYWNDIVAGVLVAGIAGYNAYQTRRERRVTTAEPEMTQERRERTE